ncbi:MAG: hypothetical protein ACK4MJ_06770, partial [Hylemonella sp.]
AMIRLACSRASAANWRAFSRASSAAALPLALASAATPRPIIQLLNEVTNKALADPEIKAQMLAQGNELGGGTPEQFAAHIKAESERWSKLVQSAGIKPD